MRLIRLLITLTISSLFMTATPYCQTRSFQSADELSEWTTYYYIHNDYSRIPEYLTWHQTSKILDDKKHALQPMSALLAVIFSDHPELVENWLKGVEASGNLKEAIKIALQMSGQKTLINEIYGETQSNQLFKDTSLLTMPVLRGGDLDMMWGAFMASGDTKYVSRIIDILDYSVALTGDQTLDAATRQSAIWSLASNMRQHELVHRCIMSEIANRKGELQKLLITIENEKMKYANAFPSKDGEFSGMLMITDESELSEYQKPSNKGMYFNEKETAKRGDVIAVKVIFGGMQLREDLSCDVTYDLKVLDPKGKVYDNTDLKDLVVMQMKQPTRLAVFDSRDYITIRFEPEDKLGTYKFIAKIKDNVGGRTLSITEEIKLIK